MNSSRTIALAGNPNVGKSTIFNHLTGMKQHTGNWPGKTVANARGNYQYGIHNYTLVDLPGTYSLMAHSTEEEIARNYICSQEPEAVVVICDALCLERNLNLVLQILACTPWVVVCVNLLDEAKKKKIEIDLPKLSIHLGVPVVGTSALQGKGLEELKSAVHQLIEKKQADIQNIQGANKQQHLDEAMPCLSKHQPSLLQAASEAQVIQWLQQATAIADDVVTVHNPDYDRADRRLDRLLTGRYTGLPCMLLLLLFIFWLTISGANFPSQMLSDLFLFVENYLRQFSLWLGLSPRLISLLLDGIYRTLTWVISVMLPPMAIFFPLFTLLEDAGFLPRISFNLDHYFKKAHACGKQALTMCMGFGCNAAGVVGCRIIDSPREQLIAILTNNFVPCNGRFPTLIAILTMFFAAGYNQANGLQGSLLLALMLTGVILLGIFMTLFISKLLGATVLRGVPSSFTLELPPYRRPPIRQVLLRSIFDRIILVLSRAIIAAAPAGLIIWLLANLTWASSSLLNHCSRFLDPFAYFFGLDGVILLAFILGFPANEIVVPIMLMAYLSQSSLIEITELNQLKGLLVANGWTWLTALCTLLFSLFHFPCATTCLTIRHETKSWRWTALAWALPTAIGLLTCAAVAAVARFFFFKP